MELRHIRYFVAVAESSNFTKAAARLRIAQPALSRQVQDLEEEIGVDLFTRSPRGVSLTAEGKLFLSESLALLKSADDAIQKTRALARGEYGELNIGFSPSPTVEILPPALRIFQKLHPQVSVHLHDLAGDELAEGIRTGSLQLGVMQQPIGANGVGLLFEPLYSYAICVAASPGHPLSKMKAVPLKRLSSEKLVAFRKKEYGDYHALLKRVFESEGKIPPIAAECDGASSMFTEVAAGRGVAILPAVFQKIVGARLKLRPLDPAPMPQEVGIVRAISGDVTPAGDKFCTELRKSAATLLKGK